MEKRSGGIRKKLIIRGRIISALIILMIVASQIVVSILKKTSYEFFVEYHEMSAIQDFKLSLYQLLLQTNKPSLQESEDDQTFYQILIHQAYEKLEECQKTITESHDDEILDQFPGKLATIEKLSLEYFKFMAVNDVDKKNNLFNQLNHEISEALKHLDIILIETKIETEKYDKINKTVFNHSSLAILSLGIIILLIFITGGYRFIDNLTKPIKDLVSTTKRIIRGERDIKVRINTGDEFEALAESFNNMLDSLESTTVSKSYLDNILTNMFDSLIVTDRKLLIRSANKSAYGLTGYSEPYLEGKPLSLLLAKIDNDDNSENDLEHWKNTIKELKYLIHNDGHKISALISCAILVNEQGESDGLIIVCHDLTIKNEIEKKLEQSRKQRQIDINEAQEIERMRIATDLHDGLGQMLTAISYSSQEFKNFETLTKNQKENLIYKIQEQVDNAIVESKDLSQNLIPIVLKDFGLIVAIQNLIEKARESHDIDFNFNAFDFNERINTKLEKALYRICQESLNNILKHSEATEVNYQIFKQDQAIVLVIDDNGLGFDLKKYHSDSNKGIGLISMRERAQSFGGSLSIDSQVGKGTELIVEIPLINSYEGS